MTENEWNAVYAVWLQQALGEGSRYVPSLLEYFGSCKAVYEADEQELRLTGFLPEKEVTRLADFPLDSAEEIVEACKRLGYRILTPDAAAYPDRLRNIPDYPAALYYLGEWPDIDDEVCIAMVGTRRASRYGYTAATDIAKDLSACGAVIISGCARGIDTAAHQGALLAGGKTLAVLGCGLNVSYNMENDGLRRVISTSGALITEYPPGSPPLGFHFPIRNRIISALSLGVIVIEAGVKSGSLITANLALEQGKDIFALPGEVTSYFSKGTNRLILDGARPIENAGDVLAEYIERFPHRIRSVNLADQNSRVFEKHVRPKWDREALAEMAGTEEQEERTRPSAPDSGETDTERKPAGVKKEPVRKQPAPQKAPAPVRREKAAVQPEESAPLGMSQSAQRVWRALTEEPKHFQVLLEETGMEPAELSRCMMELQLYGAVKALAGNQFVKG